MIERRYLMNREVQSSDSAVREIELPRTGFLSAIDLRTEITNGATSGTEEIIDALDRIEVIANGSQVVHSLEGVELYRLTSLFLKNPPPGVRSMAASAVQESFLRIPFGFFVGDPEHYLDLARYQRVTLRIQYSPTIAATGFTTGTTTFTAILHIWPEGAPGLATRGYLRTSQVRAFTSAASGEEVIEMARQYPHLGYLIYNREAAIDPDVDITTVEVREDNGRLIPFTARWLDLVGQNEHDLGYTAVERGRALRTAADTIDTLATYLESFDPGLIFDYVAGTDFVIYNAAAYASDRVTVDGIIVEASATYAATVIDTTLRRLQWVAHGRGLGNAVWVPLHQWGKSETAYQAQSKSRVQLALTQGGAGATVRVSTMELAAA